MKGSLSKDKHEILFTKFGINYNDVSEVFKKGTILLKITEMIDEKQISKIIEVHENLVDC